MDRLLRIKLVIPGPPGRRVARPRLDELLDGGLERRLVLLSAPPGFGKTTALVDWLTGSGARWAWLSIDEADNDPVRFLRYLWVAVAGVGIDPGDEPPEAALVSQADPTEVLGEIVAMLAESPGPVILALDDYHVIERPEIHRWVGFLLDHLPPHAHLAIATRADPPLSLGRLRARGELLEVRADALRFTPPEAREFFVRRMDLELADSDVEALVRRTEGWAAALQLAGLSLAGRADVDGFVRDFAGTHRFLLDYVTEEVLGRLDPTLTEFLLRTSVLDRLTGPLCDALTGGSDGQAVLERLERANLLIVALDETRQWYRYHRLFGDLLRARLEALHAGDLPGLHLRAGDWYEAHGFIGDAIEHALRSGDLPRCRTLLQRYSKDVVHAGELVTLRGWLDRLPNEVVRGDPQLSTTYAWVLALSGETEGVAERLAEAEAALQGSEAAGARADIVPTQIAGIRSVLARLEDDPRAAVAHAEHAVRLVPPGLPPELDALLMGDAHALLGHALLAAGEADRAIDAYLAARPLLQRAGNRLAAADITRNVARLEARRGRLRAALDACDQALAQAVRAGVTEEPALAPVHLARAEILERLGDDRADEAAGRALDLASRGGDAVTIRDARALRERHQARLAAARPAGALAEGAPARKTRGPVEPLTERELEILRLVATGRSNRQIAAELFLALGTVKSHVHTICRKLDAANRVQAIARGRELGLLS